MSTAQREARLNLRLTADEMAEIRAAAAQVGMNVAAFARHATVTRAHQMKQPMYVRLERLKAVAGGERVSKRPQTGVAK